MSAEGRLERLYPALTARERGVLVLKALKAGDEPDRLIYDTTPNAQSDAFNRYIRLMNVANVELASVLFTLREQMEKIEMKHAWLQTIRFWAEEIGSLRVLTALNTKEPITASEYAKREEEARAELLPLAECAGFLVEDHPWSDEDYVIGEDGEREVSDKAWNRVYRVKEKQLKTLVADGTLPSKKRGRGFLIAAGVFDDWRGERTLAYPEFAWEYDVRPDEEAEQVDQARRAQDAVRRILDRAPKALTKPVDLRATIERPEGGGFGSELEHALVISVCDLVRQHWTEARSIDIVVAEIAEQFDGEDPLKPAARAMLDGCLDGCRKLREEMAGYAAFELNEPDEENISQVRSLIQKIVDD